MPNSQARSARLEELFEANSAYISSIAWSILGNRADVQDVVQDAFVTALSALREMDEPAAVRRWFAVTTVRLARRQRFRARFLPMQHADGIELTICATGASAEQQMLLREVLGVLDQVPARARNAWSLRMLEELDLQTVAGRCGCSLATTKRLIAAASSAIDQTVGDA